MIPETKNRKLEETKMKKPTLCILALVCVLVMVTGCSFHSSMSYTFSIDNGDSIVVELDTADKYRITPDIPFTITQDGKTLSQGRFIHSDVYAEYTNLEGAENVQILDSGSKDGNQYIFWCFDGKEYNYAILVGESNTGILLGNLVSQESAKECFNRLTISANS